MAPIDKPTKTRLQTRNSSQTLRVSRENRTISDVAVITRGPALGHGVWIDEEFVADVVALGDNSKNGVVSHYTHGDLSGDGLSKKLGRLNNFRVAENGEKAIADLTLFKAAEKSPDGNLSAHIMQLAEEAPKDFGASISFSRDAKSEELFYAANLKNVDGEQKFVSPDKENIENLPHARIAALHATDIVGEPAANANGLFAHGNKLPAQAERLMDFAFGLSNEAPEIDDDALPIHPERVKIFLQGYLDRKSLSIGTTIPLVGELENLKGKENDMGKEHVLVDTGQEEPLVVRPADPEELRSAKEAGRQDGISDERVRVAEIVQLGKKYLADSNLIAKAIDEGHSIEQVDRQMLETRLAKLEQQLEATDGVGPNDPPMDDPQPKNREELAYAKAKELMEKDPDLTFADAFAQADRILPIALDGKSRR